MSTMRGYYEVVPDMLKNRLLPVDRKSASTDALKIEQILMRSTTGFIKPGSKSMEQIIPEGNTFDDLIKSISAPATSYFDQMIEELCRTTTPAFTTSTTPEPAPPGNPVSTPRQQDTDEIWLQDTFIVKATPKPTTAGDLPAITQLLEYRRPDHEHYSAMIGAVMAHLQTHKNLPEVLVIHSTEIAAYTSAVAQHEGMYAGVMHYWGSPVRLLTEKDVPEWVRVLLDASIIPVGMIFSAA